MGESDSKINTTMETKLINELGMVQSTQLCLDKNKSLVKDSPGIVRVTAALTGVVNLILGAQRRQAASEGLVAEKSDAKKSLVASAIKVSSLAHACADENGLAAIAKRTSLSPSKLQGGTEAELIDRCKGILVDAQELAEETDDCEITAAQFKELENAIKGFEGVKSKPRVGTAEGSGATKQLPVLFRRAKSLLRRRLDRLMVPFKQSNPDFYAEYKAARKVVNQAATRETKKLKLAKKADGSAAKAA